MKIVAPAGSFEKMDAAIKAGANEVYFGLKGFGARRNNKNFGIQEILDGIFPKLIPLVIVLFTYYLMTKKKLSALKAMMVLLVIAIVGVLLGVF